MIWSLVPVACKYSVKKVFVTFYLGYLDDFRVIEVLWTSIKDRGVYGVFLSGNHCTEIPQSKHREVTSDTRRNWFTGTLAST